MLGNTALREMLQRLQRSANKYATLSRGECHVPARGKKVKADGAKPAEGGGQGGGQGGGKRKRGDAKLKEEGGARKGAGRKRKSEVSAEDGAGAGRKRYVSTVDAEGIPQYPTAADDSHSQSQPEQTGALDALAMAASGSMMEVESEPALKAEGAGA